MELKPFLHETRALFETFLQPIGSPLSAYSFLTHFLWQDHFSFYWAVHRLQFLLFARYDRCIYMPLPPLGPPDRQTILDCFDLMERENPDRAVSRIENLSEADAPFYRENGFVIEPKDPEYFYSRAALAALKGDRYKSQRAVCNSFEKQYRPTSRPYGPDDEAFAWALFQKWSADRAARHSDPVYRFMLQDVESVHRRALSGAAGLGLTGRVVETKGEIVGYTLGFPLNPETFCILLEVTDREKKGAAAYIFREFCRSLTDLEWINAMDDSGLPDLRRTKESYRPERKLGVFLARRGTV
jgi:hypothetical protein